MDRTTANQPTVRQGSPWLVLVALAIGVMMEAMDSTVITVANPAISAEMNAGLPALQWLANGYMITQAVLLIAAGKLGDRFGHRRMFFIGLVGFVVASVLVGVSQTITQMIGFRLLQGAFSALLLPSAMGLLRLVFPPEKLKMAIGAFMSAFVVGGVIGPLVGGAIVNVTTWRWVFFINVGLGAIAFVMGLLTLRRTPVISEPRPLDLPGIALLTAAMLSLVLAITQGPFRGWTSAFTLVCLVLAVVFGTLFVLRERSVDAPALPLSMFRTGPVSASVLATMITGGLSFGSWFYVMLYLQNVHGYRPLQAALFLLPVTILFVVGSPIGGGLNQKFGPKVPMLAGMLLVAIGAFGLSQLTASSPYLAIWPFLALTGLGVSFVVPTATEVIVSHAPVEMAGVASGLGQTALLGGNILGIAVIGAIISGRVTATLPGHLADEGAPAEVATALLGQASHVAEGRVPEMAGQSADAMRQIVAAAHSAFMDGMNVALLVTAIVVVLAMGLISLVRKAPVEAP
ncbi:DHA2 family efflux MFS transporter permease subunit [Lentzea sp. BCCO 10_0856]|uniref:DHA2 family efflux MFS transporter permease subunit n=1 Tax=Lentzea miocenica TaxID=3095431 RepID=A0ABU4T7J5_9PSEU|nr:DHA2 family efflux MFS transporter permease subunit [Lentzea sp. BCCO 10_0856]MDX8034145.1 DHA2 family efflux MFS transporter permease subunit [Lentzea sp. BCCO 10_0856]